MDAEIRNTIAIIKATNSLAFIKNSSFFDMHKLTVVSGTSRLAINFESLPSLAIKRHKDS